MKYIWLRTLQLSRVVLLLAAVKVVKADEQILECTDKDTLFACNSSCVCIAQSNSTVITSFDDNVGLAFALVTGAGLSTALGASLVFCQRTVRQENHFILAGSLGFSSGVMLYVSFVEIFVKSIDAFDSCNSLEEDPCLWNDEGNGSAAYIMASICVFAGIFLTFFLDVMVICLTKAAATRAESSKAFHDSADSSEQNDFPVQDDLSGEKTTANVNQSTEKESYDPEAIKDKVESASESSDQVNIMQQKESKGSNIEKDTSNVANPEKKKLLHMGVMTALAIGLHNFPEGLATFVATLADPSVGIALAVAIAIHNIPEGLCVAVPLYYSTGSRLKGFCYALLSGVTEIIGAVLGYLFLRAVFGNVAYGVLFGVVTGMMVTIVIKELIPTAHRYDPEDRIVTISFFFGSFVMAASLILFAI